MSAKTLSSLFLLVCYAFPPVHSSKPIPYLALIEVHQDEKDTPAWFNGAFLSMLWVMTVSQKLAQEPSGTPRNTSKLFVHGGMALFNSPPGTSHVSKKAVIKIVTDVSGTNNKVFPNLVLLQVESAFKQTYRLEPATINVGHLNDLGLMVGFAYMLDPRTSTDRKKINEQLKYPARTWSNTVCKTVSVVKYKEQFCTNLEPMYVGSQDEYFLDGALLVDQNQFVTGMLQFTSNVKETNDSIMGLLILVRLSYFQSFWRSHEKETKETYSWSHFEDEWGEFPWNPKGYHRAPKIKPLCSVNSQCDQKEECEYGFCKDPCVYIDCHDSNAACVTTNHKPKCSCKPGYKKEQGSKDGCLPTTVDKPTEIPLAASDTMGSFSPWVLALDTSLLFFLFLFYRRNGSLVY